MDLKLVLLISIVLVLVIDFVINTRKKPTSDESVKKIGEVEPKSKSKFSFDFITKRKRNIVSFTILVHVLKILINYFGYPRETDISRAVRALYRAYNTGNDGAAYELNARNFDWSKKLSDYPINEKFIFYIEQIYTIELWLFLPSFIILGVFVWLINDKIKAR